MGLIEGETLTFQDDNKQANLPKSDIETNEKYIKGEVRIVTEQARYPLPSIPIMLDSGNYLLNPEFQRRHRWTNEQKSKLIESFIMNVPIPPIFLYEDEFSHYEVMDGLQRLTAINDFYKNRFSLDGLEFWPELNGKSYSELPLQIKKGVDRRYLSSIILLQETAKDENEAKELKQLVFERINSGGLKLKAQESRNAIYNGPLNELCLKLSRNKFLCKTWDIPEPTPEELRDENKILSDDLLKNEAFREMQDVELVLRFFANRQKNAIFKNGANLSEFLDTYLQYGNKYPKHILDELGELFNKTIEFTYKILGEKAFWLYRQRAGKSGKNWNWYQRPTVTVYDPFMLVATDYLDYKEVILSKGINFEEEFMNFYQANYDKFEGRNVNLPIFKERESLFRNLFDSFIK